MKWRDDQTKIRVAGEDTGTTRKYGFRLSPLNLAHLAGNPAQVTADLPAKFDLREYNVVPAIRDQASWGTCWAFATIAAPDAGIGERC